MVVEVGLVGVGVGVGIVVVLAFLFDLARLFLVGVVDGGDVVVELVVVVVLVGVLVVVGVVWFGII